MSEFQVSSYCLECNNYFWTPTCEHQKVKQASEPYVTKGADGLPVIVVPADPEKQLEYQIRQAKEQEFDRLMRLLKANNGAGAMTPAMWLLYEEAYYSQGYSGVTKWKRYLTKLEGNN